MTRGNQREIDRARAAARHAGKGTKNEGDPAARRENDKNALQAKLAAKAAKKAKEAEEEAARKAFDEAAGIKEEPEAAAKEKSQSEPTSKKKKKKEDLSFLSSMA